MATEQPEQEEFDMSPVLTRYEAWLHEVRSRGLEQADSMKALINGKDIQELTGVQGPRIG